MAQAQFDKFSASRAIFSCPLCGGKIRCEAGSLRCTRGHCYDISARGYVNFIPQQKPLKGYDQAFFKNRRRFLADGFYSHILEGVSQRVQMLSPRRVIDAGCGEGYYAQGIQQVTSGKVIAFDIARDAVHIAATPASPILWMVADLSHIPLQRGTADCLLNIFTPANYAEFSRVLTPGATVIKAVPGPEHLKELRHSVREHIRSEEYSNQQVVDYFAAHFDLLERVPLTHTYPISSEQLHQLFGMTPLLFGVSQDVLDNCRIDHITIDAELLIGRKK